MSDWQYVLFIMITWFNFSLLNAYLAGKMEKLMGNSHGAWAVYPIFGPFGTVVLVLFFLAYCLFDRENIWKRLFNAGKGNA